MDKKCNHIWLVGESYTDGFENKKYVDGICIYCGEIQDFIKSDLKDIKYIKKNEHFKSLIDFIIWIRNKQEEYNGKDRIFDQTDLKEEIERLGIENNL